MTPRAPVVSPQVRYDWTLLAPTPVPPSQKVLGALGIVKTTIVSFARFLGESPGMGNLFQDQYLDLPTLQRVCRT